MPPYEQQENTPGSILDHAIDNAKHEIENAKQLLQENEREMVNEATPPAAADEDQEADKSMADKVRETLPESAKDAGAKVGAMIDSGAQQVKDAMSSRPSSTKQEDEDDDTNTTTTPGKILDNAIDTAKAEMENAKNLLQEHEQEMVEEATPPPKKEGQEEAADKKKKKKNKGITDKILDAVPESAINAGSKLGGMIDSGVQNVKDAITSTQDEEEGEGEAASDKKKNVVDNAIHKAKQEMDKAETLLIQKLNNTEVSSNNVMEKEGDKSITDAFAFLDFMPDDEKENASGSMLDDAIETAKKELEHAKEVILREQNEECENNEEAVKQDQQEAAGPSGAGDDAKAHIGGVISGIQKAKETNHEQKQQQQQQQHHQKRD